MAQKVPFGGGWSRWQATYTYSSTNTINSTTTLVAPQGSELLDPTLRQRFRTANAANATTITEAGLSSPGWFTNQWANYYVYAIAGTGAGQYSLITSNTSGVTGVLTFGAVGTPFDGTTVYTIRKNLPYGAPTTINPNTGAVFSTASGAGTTTTIVDSVAGAFWTYNQWQGYQVRIIGGTQSGQSSRVIKNDATTLTFAPAIAGSTANDSVYQLLPPTVGRIVLTELELVATAATTTAAGFWSIDSFDFGGTNALVTPLHKFGWGINTGATTIMLSNTEMTRVGFGDSGLRITPSGWTGTNIAIALSIGGYYVDPSESQAAQF